jgi:hypothetical protein
MMPTSTISISPLSQEDIPGAIDAIQVGSTQEILLFLMIYP